MPVIELVPASCKHCGSGKRVIGIQQFKKNMFNITQSTINIWGGKKKCWVCKKTPVEGEAWGISINSGEKNRIYCPECSEVVDQKLAAEKLGVAETLRTTNQGQK